MTVVEREGDHILISNWKYDKYFLRLLVKAQCLTYVDSKSQLDTDLCWYMQRLSDRKIFKISLMNSNFYLT